MAREFSTGLCDCSDVGSCAAATLCFPCEAAAAWKDLTGEATTSLLVGVSAAAMIATPIVAPRGDAPVSVVPFMVAAAAAPFGAYYRWRMRQLVRERAGVRGSCASDFVITCCCSCCAMRQQRDELRRLALEGERASAAAAATARSSASEGPGTVAAPAQQTMGAAPVPGAKPAGSGAADGHAGGELRRRHRQGAAEPS